jgi:hypothetical protein
VEAGAPIRRGHLFSDVMTPEETTTATQASDTMVAEKHVNWRRGLPSCDT